MFWQRDELVCQEVVELISDYIEGALPRAQRRRLERHLDDCEHCTEYLAQMRATIRLTGTLGTHDLTPKMQTDLVELYRRWRADPD
jgi:anti-sigma factor RsiW